MSSKMESAVVILDNGNMDVALVSQDIFLELRAVSLARGDSRTTLQPG